MGATLDDDEAAAVTEAAEADGGVGTEAECRERRVDAALMGLRLDKALTLLAPEFSRSHLQGLIEAGHVRLDGVVAGTEIGRAHVLNSSHSQQSRMPSSA